MKWTQFMDMHSGGGTKEAPYEYIYIEAPKDEARRIFFNRFGHNPERVSCTCCGDDYSISESATLQEATAYERGCEYAYFDKDGNERAKGNTVQSIIEIQREGYKGRWVERQGDKLVFNKYVSLEFYEEAKNVLIIRDKDIKPEERSGEVPEQGYVWKE